MKFNFNLLNKEQAGCSTHLINSPRLMDAKRRCVSAASSRQSDTGNCDVPTLPAELVWVLVRRISTLFCVLWVSCWHQRAVGVWDRAVSCRRIKVRSKTIDAPNTAVRRRLSSIHEHLGYGNKNITRRPLIDWLTHAPPGHAHHRWLTLRRANHGCAHLPCGRGRGIGRVFSDSRLYLASCNSERTSSATSCDFQLLNLYDIV